MLRTLRATTLKFSIITRREPQHIMSPAWTLGTWPGVLWQPDLDPWPHFVHLATHIAPRIAPDWPRTGQTVWGGRAGDSSAGLSWDWIEIDEGIVAIADPMSMTTNLRLLGPDGAVLTTYATAPYLNRLVHALAWQPEVLRSIAEIEADATLLAPRPARRTAVQRSGAPALAV
jgi:hypothetical protein